MKPQAWRNLVIMEVAGFVILALSALNQISNGVHVSLAEFNFAVLCFILGIAALWYYLHTEPEPKLETTPEPENTYEEQRLEETTPRTQIVININS